MVSPAGSEWSLQQEELSFWRRRSSDTSHLSAGSGGGGAGLGGGIFNFQGALTVTSSTLYANTATGGYTQGTNAGVDAHGYGGGIFNLNGTVLVESSTLAANTTQKGAAT